MWEPMHGLEPTDQSAVSQQSISKYKCTVGGDVHGGRFAGDDNGGRLGGGDSGGRLGGGDSGGRLGGGDSGGWKCASQHIFRKVILKNGFQKCRFCPIAKNRILITKKKLRRAPATVCRKLIYIIIFNTLISISQKMILAEFWSPKKNCEGLPPQYVENWFI